MPETFIRRELSAFGLHRHPHGRDARDTARWLALLIIAAGALFSATSAHARDLASMPWKEFAERSTFIFAGQLLKAEILDFKATRDSAVRYTYKVTQTFKGHATNLVTFEAPLEENINKEVGRAAIVALRKVDEKWVLSVDERSCWKMENRMKKGFGGVPVYDVPTALITALPEVFREEVEVLVPNGQDFRAEVVKVFPAGRIERELAKALP